MGELNYGGCIALLRPEDANALGVVAPTNAPFAISCWRGRGSLNVLVSKQECLQMAERLEEALAKARQAKGHGAVGSAVDIGDAIVASGVDDTAGQRRSRR
jgi:hypothetical protein